MANKTSLIITSTSTGGKTFSKTLTDVQGKADPADLKAFAQGLTALTTNTYNSAALIERTELDEISPLAPQVITLLDGSKTEYRQDEFTEENDRLYVQFSYLGDGEVSAEIGSVLGWANYVISIGKYQDKPTLTMIRTNFQSVYTYDIPIKIRVAESATHAAGELTITIKAHEY